MRQFRRYPSWSVWVCAIGCAVVAARYWWGGDENTLRHAAEGSSLSGQLVAGEFEVVRVERTDLLIVRQQVPVLGKDSLTPLE
ncbi:MAG: hypothetical protein K8R36_15955, partial [Planctomycetales bacterium]|nr:hypothetical protein [Planctomycetales bacterium]